MLKCWDASENSSTHCSLPSKLEALQNKADTYVPIPTFYVSSKVG